MQSQHKPCYHFHIHIHMMHWQRRTKHEICLNHHKSHLRMHKQNDLCLGLVRTLRAERIPQYYNSYTTTMKELCSQYMALSSYFFFSCKRRHSLNIITMVLLITCLPTSLNPQVSLSDQYKIRVNQQPSSHFPTSFASTKQVNQSTNSNKFSFRHSTTINFCRKTQAHISYQRCLDKISVKSTEQQDLRLAYT